MVLFNVRHIDLIDGLVGHTFILCESCYENRRIDLPYQCPELQIYKLSETEQGQCEDCESVKNKQVDARIA